MVIKGIQLYFKGPKIVCLCISVGRHKHLWKGVPGEENIKNADVSLVICCLSVSVFISYLFCDSKQVLKQENNTCIMKWLIMNHC